ncbi:unnamed protein product [Soboliphyme baturini]|uniref:Putative exosome complex component RRP41 n=1 Tax=Soboliphyme baturini TaxID=241478 RepID=A0A183J203_9BILA|nr:unnamed protein product [Soboliphyme baturini]
MELVSEHGYRQDGRKPHELRRMACRLGPCAQADGSAYLEQGLTKVLVTVYGPHEMRKNKGLALPDRAVISCRYCVASFATGKRTVQGLNERKAQEVEQLVTRAFEPVVRTALYPYSQIDILCEVLQADGSTISACLNAATVALIDAGIAMNGYICSCSSTMYNDTTIVDLNHLEEGMSSGPEMVLALFPKSEEIVVQELSSRLHEDQFEKFLCATIAGCKSVAAILDDVIRKNVNEVAWCLGWH